MDGWDFVDLATKAKELSISDGTLRARLLSGDLLCFTHVTKCRAHADEGEWLPAYDPERFPMVEWIDHGSAFRGDRDANPRDGWPPNRKPCYHIFGWIALAPDITATILTRGSTPVDYAPVGILDCDSKLACRLVIHVDPRREWVTVNGGEYAEGGYWRDIPATLKPNDLYLRAAADSASKTLSPRKEQSYLGIIAAMRALLRDKDGGAFPSEAKIIDQLVDRYKTVDGVSKRKLEDVFADATRTAGDLTRPK